jgi:hypothetical protein
VCAEKGDALRCRIRRAFVRQQILRSLNKSVRVVTALGLIYLMALAAQNSGTNSLALRHLISTRLFSRQNIARAATLRGFIPRLIRILRVTESLPHSERSHSHIAAAAAHARSQRATSAFI